MKVITYQKAPHYGEDQISLCEMHARTQMIYNLGPVSHGRHEGTCAMCHKEEW